MQNSIKDSNHKDAMNTGGESESIGDNGIGQTQVTPVAPSLAPNIRLSRDAASGLQHICSRRLKKIVERACGIQFNLNYHKRDASNPKHTKSTAKGRLN